MPLRALTADDLRRHGFTGAHLAELRALEESESVDERGRLRWQQLRQQAAEAQRKAELALWEEFVSEVGWEAALDTVREIEKRGDDMTIEELRVLAVAMRASYPKSASESAWDRWQSRSIADSLTHAFSVRKVCSMPRRGTGHAHRRGPRRGPRARRGRSTSSRGSPRQSSDDDPEPDLDVIPLAVFRREVERALGGAR